jgi:uncharacterized protein YukE
MEKINQFVNYLEIVAEQWKKYFSSLDACVEKLIGEGWKGKSAGQYVELKGKAKSSMQNIHALLESVMEELKSGVANVFLTKENENRLTGIFGGTGKEGVLAYSERANAAVDEAAARFHTELNCAQAQAESARQTSYGLHYRGEYGPEGQIDGLPGAIQDYGSKIDDLMRAYKSYAAAILYFDKCFGASIDQKIQEMCQNMRVTEKSSILNAVPQVGSIAWRAKSLLNFIKQFETEMKSGSGYVTQADIDAIEKIIYNAAEPYRTILYAYMEKADIVFFDSKHPVWAGFEKAENSLFSAFTGKIYLCMDILRSPGNEDNKGQAAYEAVFHEIGHMIDYYYGTQQNLLLGNYSDNINGLYEAQSRDIEGVLKLRINAIIEDPKFEYDPDSVDVDAIIHSILVSSDGYDPDLVLEGVTKKVAVNLKEVMNAELNVDNNTDTVSDIYAGHTDDAIRGGFGHDKGYFMIYDWEKTPTGGRTWNNFEFEQWAGYFGNHIMNAGLDDENERNYFKESSVLLEGMKNDIWKSCQ